MKKIFAYIGVMLLVAGSAFAAPTLGQTWVFTGTDWNNALVDESIPAPPTVVLDPPGEPGAGTSVTMNFKAWSGSGDWFPVGAIHTTSQNGDWNTLGGMPNALTINFTLSNVNSVPDAFMRAYFTTAGGTYYSTPIAVPLTSGSFSIPMVSGFLDENSLSSSLVGITDFGFQVQAGNSLLAQSYVFGDISVNVPEPETVWMMLMVLVSLGITFRGRLLELGKLALASVRK